MTWLRLDDTMYRNPKVHGLTSDGFRVHVGGLLHCCQQLTDGLVSTPALYSLFCPGMRDIGDVASELVSAGLWGQVEGGWQINDFLEFNPSRAEVVERREADAARKRASRRKPVERPVDNSESRGESHSDVRADGGPESHDAPFGGEDNKIGVIATTFDNVRADVLPDSQQESEHPDPTPTDVNSSTYVKERGPWHCDSGPMRAELARFAKKATP